MRETDRAPEPPGRAARELRLSRRRLLLGTAGATLAALAFGCTRLLQPGSSDLPSAPDFTAERYGGGTFQLSSLRGTPVFLNFWASWCAPCKAEMPGFEHLWQRYKDRKDHPVQFVGVNVNDLQMDYERFLRDEVHVSYTIVRTENLDVPKAYEVSGLPFSVFITRDGKIAKSWLGSLAEDKLDAFLQEQL